MKDQVGNDQLSRMVTNFGVKLSARMRIGGRNRMLGMIYDRFNSVSRGDDGAYSWQSVETIGTRLHGRLHMKLERMFHAMIISIQNIDAYSISYGLASFPNNKCGFLFAMSKIV